MYYFAQGDDDASMDVNLARFDSHGNLSEDEFDTYTCNTLERIWSELAVSKR